MAFSSKIRLLLLTILTLILFINSSSFTINSELELSDFNESDIYLTQKDINSLSPGNNLISFPPDTTLTLQQQDSLRADSIRLGLIEIDSSMYDSTARLEHFRYIREESRFLELEPSRRLSFYAQPSQRYLRRTVQLDSTGTKVIIKEFIANVEIRPPLIVLWINILK